MNKEEYITKYGEAALLKMRMQSKEWNKEHPEEVAASRAASHAERNMKGGKYYNRHLIYEQTGLRGERNRVRKNHGSIWRKYKNIIAPGSQLHHEWIPGTADYRGVALVEADQHMHGIVDPIVILEGKITLLTEEEIKNDE